MQFVLHWNTFSAAFPISVFHLFCFCQRVRWNKGLAYIREWKTRQRQSRQQVIPNHFKSFKMSQNLFTFTRRKSVKCSSVTNTEFVVFLFVGSITQAEFQHFLKFMHVAFESRCMIVAGVKSARITPHQHLLDIAISVSNRQFLFRCRNRKNEIGFRFW